MRANCTKFQMLARDGAKGNYNQSTSSQCRVGSMHSTAIPYMYVYTYLLVVIITSK